MIQSNLGTDLLKENGIVFTVKNNGAHVIVEGNNGFIDYWPSTGRWKSRDGEQGFGAHNLVNYIKQGSANQ